MKLKLFVFLALLFAGFLFSSAAVTEKSKDETKLNSTEDTNQGDDAKYVCKHRCCSHRGCRCCSYAEAKAQLMGAQAKDDKYIVAEELNNQQNEVNYQGNGYGGRGGGGNGGGGHGGGRGGGGHGGGRGGGGGRGRGGGGNP